jgi:hypothetical protein
MHSPMPRSRKPERSKERTPDLHPKSTKDELVATILDQLKPFRTLPRGEIAKHVRKTLDGSLWVMPRADSSARRKNNDHIKRLRGAIRRLVYQISKAPAPVRVSAFSGTQLRAIYGRKPSVIRVSSSERDFLAELKEVDQRLSAAKEKPKRDPIKQLCAEMARDFFLFYSEKLPGSSSKTSAFRVVASLVYEYFTDKAEQDLERFCETALRTIYDHPLYVRKKGGWPRSPVKTARTVTT